MGGKLPKLLGSKAGEQWYKVQLVLGYYWRISGIHRVHALSFDADGVECPLRRLQVTQNCWSGVVDSLQARADVLRGMDTMEQRPGRSLVTEQGTKQCKCSYVALQQKLWGWFSEALSRLVSAHTNNSSDRITSTLSFLFCFQGVIFFYIPIDFAVLSSSNILILLIDLF